MSALLAQLAARQSHNLKVLSSNLREGRPSLFSTVGLLKSQVERKENVKKVKDLIDEKISIPKPKEKNPFLSKEEEKPKGEIFLTEGAISNGFESYDFNLILIYVLWAGDSNKEYS